MPLKSIINAFKIAFPWIPLDKKSIFIDLHAILMDSHPWKIDSRRWDYRLTIDGDPWTSTRAI